MRPIVNMQEEDQATDTGNTHKKNGKDRARVVLEIFSRTDKSHRRTYSSQYFATAPVGEVNIILCQKTSDTLKHNDD